MAEVFHQVFDLATIRRKVADGNRTEQRHASRSLLTALDGYGLGAGRRGEQGEPYVAWDCKTCPGGYVGIVAFEPDPGNPPGINQVGLTLAHVVERVLEHHRDEHNEEVNHG